MKINTPEIHLRILRIKSLLEAADTEFQKLDGATQNELNELFVGENYSLGHCLRWGLQACESMHEHTKPPKRKRDKRKFYRASYVFEVLSEEPTEGLSLDTALEEATNGCLSGDVNAEAHQELDATTCAHALGEQGSDPGFFQLNADGSPADDF